MTGIPTLAIRQESVEHGTRSDGRERAGGEKRTSCPPIGRSHMLSSFPSDMYIGITGDSALLRRHPGPLDSQNIS